MRGSLQKRWRGLHGEGEEDGERCKEKGERGRKGESERDRERERKWDGQRTWKTTNSYGPI